MNLCILSQCTSSKQDYHSRCIYIYVNIYIDIDIDFSYIYNFRYFLHLDAWPRKLKVFLEDPNKFHPKFTRDSSEENVAFLYLKVKLKQGKIKTDCMLNLRTGINTFIILPHTRCTLSDL